MADVVGGGAASHDVQSLLSSPDGDFLIRNNGDQVKVDSLKGKKIGLYFSASWCGPCQQFTPTLVEVYNELSPRGDLEIIFISRDEDEESFSGYFSKMPWLAIPFSDSDKRNSLNEFFKVRGIPHLVILDGTGIVLTDRGDEIVCEYGAEGHPFTPERIKELKEQEEAARRNQSLTSLLVHGSRDFVVLSDGNQVAVTEFEGKTVGLYFSLSTNRSCVDFTPKLLEVYEKLKAKGESFEIVQIPLDKDEASFNQSFGSLPWFSLPLKDKKCEKLIRYFELLTLPTLVIIGQDGKTLHSNVVETVEEHGVAAYPFTPERIKELKEQEEAARRNQSLTSLLVHESRDFVVSSNGNQVPVTELEGKTVGLYFSLSVHRSCADFMPKLLEVYEKLKAKGESFEIVQIPLDDDEASFNQSFGSMPWFSLPLKDKKCEKLARYFELSTLPTLVIIGQDGKTLHSNVAETVEEHGVAAYPFTPEKFAELAEIEKKREESQTLESILVSGDLDFVIGKDGTKIPVSDLVGKTVLLYFSAHWCPPCRAFLPVLIEAYEKIKATDNAFEVIFISSDKDQTAFHDYFAEMPWLALPFGDERKKFLSRKFKVQGIPMLVAIGPTGRTVTNKTRGLIMEHGADAYPFTAEHLKKFEEKFKESIKGWPEKLKHPLHEEHELIPAQRRMYICDGCKEPGEVWSYYCKGCDFDLHPKCAVGEEKATKNESDEDNEAAEEEAKEGGDAKEGWVCDGEVCYKA